ncbi:hypothetical protein R3P38DRAFT_3202037 [Favolaschia claudopus]|uniref:Uncharacterized protein n=1 Tax=Favolaschia claudopus TaxID=2862362 RepID=A0AAW0AUC7_9AGAR
MIISMLDFANPAHTPSQRDFKVNAPQRSSPLLGILRRRRRRTTLSTPMFSRLCLQDTSQPPPKRIPVRHFVSKSRRQLT